MKVIAIIDVPDGEGKWYIDGEIRYTENESLMKKFDADMIPLKPLPKKKEIDNPDGYYDLSQLFHEGWNYCIDAITGENK